MTDNSEGSAPDEALDWYEAHADHFADELIDVPLVDAVVWPGMESLLPPLSGERVLDAGCGDGTYTRRLAARGADVTAVDGSRALVEQAESRLGDDVDVRRADLREPLPSLADGSIDVVFSQLVLDHVEDWRPVFATFERVLAPGGCAVVSVSHPPSVYAKIAFDEESGDTFDLDDPAYFETESWRPQWGPADDATVQKYRRPLEDQTGAAFEAGFVLDGLVEPTPTEAYEGAETHGDAERLRRRPPTFVCYRFRKPDGDAV
ncbi:MAG: class I SAM-dependent methyltransferase [Halobacteriaceae archaeon]